MADLIERQAAIEYFMTNTTWRDEDGYEIHDAEDKRALLKSYFDEIPPAQPEQKRGKWLIHHGLYKCSCCKRLWSPWCASVPIDQMNKLMPYCPMCGSYNASERGDNCVTEVYNT